MNSKENNINFKKKIEIFKISKKKVIEEGWSKNLSKKLIENKIKSTDLTYLFPNGYIDILNFALSQVNEALEKKIKKINIINFPVSKRVKKILSLRLNILNEDKIFYKKTFNHLLLPHNTKLMKKNLYNTVDNIWYFAGDNSTDFSFYTKRFSLAIIYVNALFVFYNKNIQESELNIENNLKKISKIPKIKNRFAFIKDNLPIFLKGILN